MCKVADNHWAQSDGGWPPSDEDPLTIKQGFVLISLKQRIGYEPSQTPILYLQH